MAKVWKLEGLRLRLREVFHRRRSVQFGVGSELARFFRDVGNDLLKFLALGGGDPGEVDALKVEAEQVEQFAEQNPAPPGVVVAGGVVAIAGMASGDQDGVGADLESLDQQVEIDATSAGQPDDANVRRILQPGRSRQIGAQVSAPVANVSQDLRFEGRSFGTPGLKLGRIIHAMLSTIA